MKQLALALIVSCAVIVSSCGKKNRAPRNLQNSGQTPGSPVYSIQDMQSVNNVKSRIPCSYNQGRRVPDITFHTSGGTATSTRTTIYGPSFQPGILGGNIGRVYVGASTFGDIITVSKVTNGPTVIGYNITFSLCNNSPLIMNERGITAMQSSGIIIDDDANCGVGRVDYAYVRLQADPYSGNVNGFPVNLVAYPFDTVFTKTQCY